ncbi:MAG TPA: hypothetical protein VEW48_05175 [Thermoanaerobaculia bacterium]|nr:hypothetical protein [Thermoanaerobaculia bacterium]
MGALSARDLLLVWEQAERRRPAERALALLAAACPELPDDARAALPLGWREARLFGLYEETFGSELELATPCPQCGETLESELRVDDLAADPGEIEPGEIEEGGLRLVLRPLSSADLAAAADCPDAAAARRLLAARSVLAASRDGVEVDPSELSATEMDVVSRGLASLDPRAEVLLDFACPGCGHRWQSLLDAADCLWREIDATARRLLREVHALARAYHWREADILAMSARRRRRYLEILAG